MLVIVVSVCEIIMCRLVYAYRCVRSIGNLDDVFFVLFVLPDYYWLKIENERTYDVEVWCFCQRQEKKLLSLDTNIIWPFFCIVWPFFCSRIKIRLLALWFVFLCYNDFPRSTCSHAILENNLKIIQDVKCDTYHRTSLMNILLAENYSNHRVSKVCFFISSSLGQS